MLYDRPGEIEMHTCVVIWINLCAQWFWVDVVVFPFFPGDIYTFCLLAARILLKTVVNVATGRDSASHKIKWYESDSDFQYQSSPK